MSKELELLEKIVINTSASIDPLWVAVITGATAVLTVLVTSVVAYKMNKNTLKLEREKIKIEIITKERMLWLRKLRENASDYVAEMDFFFNWLKRDVSTSNEQHQKNIDNLSQSIMRKSNNLLFCLIKNDAAQLALYYSINKTQSLMTKLVQEATNNTHTSYDNEYYILKKLFSDAMESISTETWKQVKNFE